MDYKNKKRQLRNYLWRYRRSLSRKAAIERRLKEAKEEMEYPISGMKIGIEIHGSTPSDGAAAIPLKIGMIESNLKEQKEYATQMMLDVLSVIDYIPTEHPAREVIEMRYLDGAAWKDIQSKKDRCRTQCMQLESQGIDMLLHNANAMKIVRRGLAEEEKRYDTVHKRT